MCQKMMVKIIFKYMSRKVDNSHMPQCSLLTGRNSKVLSYRPLKQKANNPEKKASVDPPLACNSPPVRAPTRLYYVLGEEYDVIEIATLPLASHPRLVPDDSSIRERSASGISHWQATYNQQPRPTASISVTNGVRLFPLLIAHARRSIHST